MGGGGEHTLDLHHTLMTLWGGRGTYTGSTSHIDDAMGGGRGTYTGSTSHIDDAMGRREHTLDLHHTLITLWEEEGNIHWIYITH